MKVPRVRFTVRGLMIAVAVVGVTLAAGRLSSHQGRCKAKANLNAYLEAKHLQMATHFAGDAPDLAEKHRRKAGRCRSLREKYETPGCYPWLPVAPDTSEPE